MNTALVLALAAMASMAGSSPAWAGTIQLSSPSPVGVKLDEAWVTRSGTLTTMTDVAAGSHRVHVCSLLGQPITFVDVDVGDSPVHLSFVDKRIEVAPGDAPDPAARPEGTEPASLSMAELGEIQRDLIAARPKARMRVLTDAAPQHWFHMRHVVKLVASFESLDERVMAAAVLAPRTLDPHNADALDDVMPLGAHRESAKVPFGKFVGD